MGFFDIFKNTNKKTPNVSRLKKKKDIKGLIALLSHEEIGIRETVIDIIGEINEKWCTNQNRYNWSII